VDERTTRVWSRAQADPLTRMPAVLSQKSPDSSLTPVVFYELLLEKGAEQIPALAALKKSDDKAR
jgi:hypothetical protein